MSAAGLVLIQPSDTPRRHTVTPRARKTFASAIYPSAMIASMMSAKCFVVRSVRLYPVDDSLAEKNAQIDYYI
ncbi:hypothetical protein WL00_05740 [Burkholderia cepacia]|nr:hypothetical protein WL00_05740 [Burkholderia cepacia]